MEPIASMSSERGLELGSSVAKSGKNNIQSHGNQTGLRLNPGLEMRPFKDGFRVRSPNTGKEVTWTIAEARTALCFAKSISGAEPWYDIDWDGHEQLAGTTPKSRYFFLTERWKEQGFLVEERIFTPAQLANCVFGEFAAYHLSFFEGRYGSAFHSVALHDLPAHQFFVERGETAPASEAFFEYRAELLQQRYPLLRDQQVRSEANRELESFRDFVKRFTDEGGAAAMLARPFQVCRRPDGRWLLLEESERACLAIALGYPVRVVILDPRDYLGRVTQNPTEFFGSMRTKVPYHSVYQQGECLIRGIRTDLYDRLAMFRAEDIRGKRVLDLGSNIGMNGFLALEKGAVATLGIERSRELVATQARLNAYFAVPARSKAGDLNEPIAGLGNFDTAFVLAVLGHLRGADALLTTLRNAAVKVVYFESHCDLQPQGDMEGFLGSRLFSQVTNLGFSSDNVFMGTATRKVYRCQVGS